MSILHLPGVRMGRRVMKRFFMKLVVLFANPRNNLDRKNSVWNVCSLVVTLWFPSVRWFVYIRVFNVSTFVVCTYVCLHMQCLVYKYESVEFLRQRPYHVENTGSRPITEVKQRRARLVLGWVTAWEHRVQLASSFLFFFFKRQEIDKELYIFGECYYDFRVWVLLLFCFLFLLMITTGK